MSTASGTAGLSKHAVRDLDDLRQVWRMRAFEDKIIELRRDGEVVGSVHLGSGQESFPVALDSVLAPQDAVFATYRGHCWALGCAVPPYLLFAELLGRTTGINGGRGGSAHLSAPRYGFYGENSIVGAGAPLAVGAALASRYDGSDRVVLTVFGDGAMNQGAVHEAMNFAAAYGLPVVFVCENNGWSEMTAISETTRDDHLYNRAAAYAMPGHRVDGNDPTEARAALGEAVTLARAGNGPVFLEAMTARVAGHYIGDAQQYRHRAELEQMRAAEPIAKLRARLGSAGCSADAIDRAETDAREEMDGAARRALLDPLADPTTATEHLYV